VGIDYLDYLLSIGQFDEAGRLGLQIFAKNPSLWEDQIYKFASYHQLRFVVSHFLNYWIRGGVILGL